MGRGPQIPGGAVQGHGDALGTQLEVAVPQWCESRLLEAWVSGCVHPFLSLYSVASCWQLELGQGGSIYVMGITLPPPVILPHSPLKRQ